MCYSANLLRNTYFLISGDRCRNPCNVVIQILGSMKRFSSSLPFLPSFLHSSATSFRSCSPYTFAALATRSFWNFFLFADALDMDSVHKNHSGIYQAVIQSLVQDVRKDLLIQFRWNVLTEGIAHRWKL